MESVLKGQQTKQQLSDDLKLTIRLITAVECCEFHGRNATDVAILLGFLENQRDSKKKELDAALEAEAGKLRPEFGKVPA